MVFFISSSDSWLRGASLSEIREGRARMMFLGFVKYNNNTQTWEMVSMEAASGGHMVPTSLYDNKASPDWDFRSAPHQQPQPIILPSIHLDQFTRDCYTKMYFASSPPLPKNSLFIRSKWTPDRHLTDTEFRSTTLVASRGVTSKCCAVVAVVALHRQAWCNFPWVFWVDSWQNNRHPRPAR